MVSLKPERLKRYKDVAMLLVKYGRSDLVKQLGVDEAVGGFANALSFWTVVARRAA